MDATPLVFGVHVGVHDERRWRRGDELMPSSQFRGTVSWGYNPTAFFAPQATFGIPDDLRHFVDEAHARGIAVLLDVVYKRAPELGTDLTVVRTSKTTMAEALKASEAKYGVSIEAKFELDDQGKLSLSVYPIVLGCRERAASGRA